MENVQPKWALHSAHGFGHGLTPVLGVQQALELCHSIGPAMARRQPLTLSGREQFDPRGAWHTTWAATRAGGVGHTMVNMPSAEDIRELVHKNVSDSKTSSCSQVYPLPSSYEGALKGTACELGIGVDEADRRIEFFRLGGNLRIQTTSHACTLAKHQQDRKYLCHNTPMCARSSWQVAMHLVSRQLVTRLRSLAHPKFLVRDTTPKAISWRY